MAFSLPEPHRGSADERRGAAGDAYAAEVGDFRQGSPFSRWALARYIVGRVILLRVGWSLLGIGVVLLAVAATLEIWLHVAAAAIVLLVVGGGVLLMRTALQAILRRVMGAAFGPLEDRLDTTVRGAGGDVQRELRRVGLPSHLLTLPLLPLRMLGRRRRRDTLNRLKQFEVERAVSPSRLDELHLVLQQALGDTHTGARAGRGGDR